MNVTPIVFQPVPAVRPVARVGPGAVDRLDEPAPPTPGVRGHDLTVSRRRRDRRDVIVATPGRQSSALARTLAVLTLDQAFGRMPAPPRAAD